MRRKEREWVIAETKNENGEKIENKSIETDTEKKNLIFVTVVLALFCSAEKNYRRRERHWDKT